MDGATVLARSLKIQGVQYAFGIVGIPVVEVAHAFQTEGIHFIAMRNEQAASYAASAVGYLTKRPAVCLVVSGPGFVHALAGLSNSNENCWPVIVIGGASDTQLVRSGAFQEFDQAAAANRFCKFSARFPSVDKIPFLVQQAVKHSLYGRPGAVYLDLPGDFVQSMVEEVQFVPFVPEPPVCLAFVAAVTEVVALIQTASRPLLIIGKGAAYDRAEKPLRDLVDDHQLPFLPTPMGKGVVSDSHPCCVSSSRTAALRGADLIILCGARLNWMLHFGLPPRFDKNVKVVQIDICPEEFHTNVITTVPLMGNIGAVVSQISEVLPKSFKFSRDSDWWKILDDSANKNRAKVDSFISDAVPMTYYSVFNEVRQFVKPDWMIVSEGANTMDIGRTMLPNMLPRHRLDAGTFGTMGVGLGFGVAAALCGQCERVLCVEGDSAVGFSLMEAEVMVRYKLPIFIIVLNNSGIYGGLPKQVLDTITSGDSPLSLVLPASSLGTEVRYDLVMQALGGQGHFVRSVPELREALTKSVAYTDGPVLINAIIDTGAERKTQDFDWLTRAKI